MACGRNPDIASLIRATAEGAGSHHAFPTDGAAIHHVFEPLHGRTRIMPGEPGARRPAPHDLVGQKRIKVMHGVDLRRRGISPAEAELGEAALQLAQHVACFLAQRSLTSALPAITKLGTESVAATVKEKAWNDGSAGGSISGHTLLRATGFTLPSNRPHFCSVTT